MTTTPWGLRPWLLVTIIAVMGTIDILLIQYASKITVANNEKNPITHPYFHAALIIVAELLCLVLFGLGSAISAPFRTKVEPSPSSMYGGNNSNHLSDFEQQEQSNQHAPFIWALLPGFCAVAAAVFMLTGLLMTDSNMYSILRGLSILFTLWLSIIFLGRKYNLSHILGIFLLVGGLLLLGAYTFSESTSTLSLSVSLNSINKSKWSIIFILLSQLLISIKLIWCEYIFTKYTQTEPLKLIGYCGVWGFFFLSLWLTGLIFLPINHHQNILTLFTSFFHLFSLPAIQLLICFNLVSIFFYQWASMSLTKVWSAVHVSMANQLRICLIYFITLLFPMISTASSSSSLTSLNIFTLIHCISLGFIFIGWMVFHWRLPIPPSLRRTKFMIDMDWRILNYLKHKEKQEKIKNGLMGIEEDEEENEMDENDNNEFLYKKSAEYEEKVYRQIEEDENEIKSLLSGPPFQVHDVNNDLESETSTLIITKKSSFSAPRWSRLFQLLSGRNYHDENNQQAEPTGPTVTPYHQQRGYKAYNISKGTNYISKF